jgi:flagellum-specific ATP synthase
LISIGAYRTGSDPRIDAAIALRDPIRQFLQQDATQITPLEESCQLLMQLMSTQAVNHQPNADVPAQTMPAESMVENSPGVVVS